MKLLKTLGVFLLCLLFLLAFRALALTVYTVSGAELEPCFIDGDRILVNRWSYGLRVGCGCLAGYSRLMASSVERGDLVAFNSPAGANKPVSCRPVCGGYCTGVPGDSVSTDGIMFTVPGRKVPVSVTADNMPLIRFLYDRYEGRMAVIHDGRLFVDGVEIRCAVFSNDYYLISWGRQDSIGDLCFPCLVPETHVIGKVSMLLYSVDSSRPFYRCMRPGRSFQMIKFNGDKQ